MIRLYTTPLVLQFVASPDNSMVALASWGSVCNERNAFTIKVFDPGQPHDDPPESLPPRTLPEFPTDVPAPEPHDVPVPEPFDVPPPDSGEPSPGARPQKQ